MLLRPTAVPIDPEVAEVHLPYGLDDEVDYVIFRNPIENIRREQGGSNMGVVWSTFANRVESWPEIRGAGQYPFTPNRIGLYTFGSQNLQHEPLARRKRCCCWTRLRTVHQHASEGSAYADLSIVSL